MAATSVFDFTARALDGSPLPLEDFRGQVLLIVDQNLLLILSETGEVALVDATPDGHKLIAKFKAIEGKTWNHPVYANGRLYVRNGEEAACFELKVEGK